MELQANARTLTNVLSVNKKYIVPRFQREYSWGKEQINELWHDISSNIHIQPDGKYNFDEYFIGALVLVGQETSSELMIVDGQQRLTTLTILLSALCERFKLLEETAVANSIYNNYIAGMDDDGRKFFKLVNETPKPYFQNNIQHIDKRSEPPSSTEERNLQSCYNDMLDFLSPENLKIALGVQDDNYVYIEALKAIRDQILRFLKVIYITVNDEDEAYTIFETLNARGLNLSHVDLIKNKLFKRLNGTHPDDEAKTKWSKIRQIISSRNNVGSMETFLRHWWISKYSYVSSNSLYKAFMEKWKKNEIDAQCFINELLADAEIYVKISSPIDQDFPELEMKAVYKGLQALKLFNISQNKPFLLSLFKARRDGNLKLVDMNNAILSIERFHFMFNAVCSMRPSGIESAYAKAARALVDERTNKVANRQVIKSLLEMLIKRKPDYSTFVEKFIQLRFSNKEVKNKRLIQYIFYRLETYFVKTGELVPDSLTLEHIKPQSEGEEDIVSLIGNLLPLSKELNEKAGNKTIEEKVEIYKESRFALVHRFINSYENDYNKNWDIGAITYNAVEMGGISYQSVWKLGKD